MRVGDRALPPGMLPLADQEAPGGDVEDAEIVRRILDEDQDAFADLVARYQRRAFWIAYHVLGRAEDARDVVQESFVRLHRSLHRYDFARSFYTWFYRIVMNLAIDALRKRRSARAVALDAVAERPSDVATPGEPLEREELRGEVWRVLEGLDEKFKTVLILRDIHGMSCREIAPILDVTHATARWRLHRGRQVFREAWERRRRVEGRASARDGRESGEDGGTLLDGGAAFGAAAAEGDR